MAKKMRADTLEPVDNNETNSQSDLGSLGSATVAGVMDSAKQAASQAKETASHVLDQAKDHASSRVDEQKQNLASGMQAVAHAFQSMGEELRKKEQGPVADYAAEIGQAIGGQVEQLASYLRDRDIKQLVAETENFARRSPALFLGGAFAIGFAASRFLKSSRPAAPAAQLPASLSTPATQLALPPASMPPSGLGVTPGAGGSVPGSY